MGTEMTWVAEEIFPAILLRAPVASEMSEGNHFAA